MYLLGFPSLFQRSFDDALGMKGSIMAENINTFSGAIIFANNEGSYLKWLGIFISSSIEENLLAYSSKVSIDPSTTFKECLQLLYFILVFKIIYSSVKNKEELIEKISPIIFNPEIDAKRVSQDPEKDLVINSANNFYEGITQKRLCL